MPEMIINASGPQYGLVINPDGSINTSITGSFSIGSVSAIIDNIYIKSGNQVEVYGSGTFVGSITSMPAVSVLVGSESYIKGGSISVYNQVAGSIVYMPTVNANTGSNVYVKGGSITTYGVGSVYTVNSVPTGSEQWIKGGSVEVYNRVAGSIVNIPSIVGSVYVSNQISEITVGSESYIKNFNELGSSVVVTNFGALGSSRVVTNLYAGSKAWQGERWGVSGIVDIQTRVAGSIVNWPGSLAISNFNALGSSVIVTNLYAGSKAFQGDRYGISGIVEVSNMVAGSIVYMPSINVATGSESYIKGGSIEVYTGSIHVTNFSAGTGYAGSEIWIKNTVEVSGLVDINNFGDLGSSRVITNFGALGSSRVITNFGTLGSSRVITNFNDIGSSRVITNFGDLGSSVVVTNLYAGSKVWQGERFGVSGIVDITTRVAGSIVNWPGNIVISGTANVLNKVAGSIVDWPGYLGSKAYQGDRYGISGIVEVSNRVAGSIVNIPAIDINNPATIGSYTTQIIVGSVYQTNSTSTTLTGSMEVFSSTGSVEVYGSLSAEAGSESWIKNWDEIGSSVVITNFNDLGSKVVIDAPQTIGSFTGMSNGSVWFGGGVGSMMISGTSQILGSVVFATGHVGSIVISGTSIPPFRGVGSVYFAGGIGSVVISGTSIPTWRGTGSVMISGTLPLWIGVGSVHIGTGIGSVYVVDINNDNGIVDLGSPNYMRGLLTASGTYTNVWRAPAAGSRIEIHGYHISTNAPGYVRLCQSGTTPVVISDWNLNYASGAVIEKTFVNPIIPCAADVPVGVGATVAGSTTVTIFGREVA